MSDTEYFDDFVLAAIARACDRDAGTLGPETSLGELDLDSLRMVGIVSQVEMAFDREFGSEAILGFFTAERVRDLVSLMR